MDSTNLVTRQQSFERDKRWSDRFIPSIKAACGLAFFEAATPIADREENTDLVMMQMSKTNIKIACRIRKNNYLASYKSQFTIRASRPKGTKTEFDKIMAGLGDFFFYGFSNKDETGLDMYTICDLSIFRTVINNSWGQYWMGSPIWQEYNNYDNSSSFYVFKFIDFPDDFIVFKNETKDNE